MTQELRPEAPTTSVLAAPRGTDDATTAVPKPGPEMRYGPPGDPRPPVGWCPAPRTAPGTAPGASPPAPGAFGPAGPPPYGLPAPTRRTEGTAVAALVCGFFVAPVGVVLGIVALARIRRRGTGGKGLAIGGLVVGTLVTLATVALIVGFVALLSSGVAGSSTPRCSNGVCETTVHGTPIAVDDIGDEELGQRMVVVSVAEGSAEVMGETDTTPTRVAAGEAFTVDGEPVELVSATGGTAVFRFNR